MGDGTLGAVGAVGGERVLSPESLKQMQTPQVRVNAEGEWGLGWSLGRAGGVRTIGHNGATNGFQAFLVAVPERNYAITMLTNSSRGTSASRGIAKWALARDLGLETPEPTRIELAPEALHRLTGVYRQALSVSTITVAEGANAEAPLQMGVVTTNPFTGEEKEWPAVGLAPIAPDACLITSGENEAGPGRLHLPGGPGRATDDGPDRGPVGEAGVGGEGDTADALGDRYAVGDKASALWGTALRAVGERGRTDVAPLSPTRRQPCPPQRLSAVPHTAIALSPSYLRLTGSGTAPDGSKAYEIVMPLLPWRRSEVWANWRTASRNRWVSASSDVADSGATTCTTVRPRTRMSANAGLR